MDEQKDGEDVKAGGERADEEELIEEVDGPVVPDPPGRRILAVGFDQTLAMCAAIGGSLSVREEGPGPWTVWVRDDVLETHQGLGVPNPYRVGEVDRGRRGLAWRVAELLTRATFEFQAPGFEEVGEYARRHGVEAWMGSGVWCYEGCSRFEAELITLCWATFDNQRFGERVLAVGEKALRRRFKRHGTLFRVGVLGGIFFPERARDYAALARWAMGPEEDWAPLA